MVGLISGLHFSPDNDRLGFNLSTAQTPSDVFVLSMGRSLERARSMTRWTFSEVGGLDTTAFREPGLISYPTFDEVGGRPREIPAWVYKPAGDGPFPVVISIHGGPEAQSRPWFVSTYQMWMAKLGVAIVVPNVRGSAGYGKTYLGLDNGFKREDSVKDIGALLDWIEAQPDLDATRVAVIGGSYGGYMVGAALAFALLPVDARSGPRARWQPAHKARGGDMLAMDGDRDGEINAACPGSSPHTCLVGELNRRHRHGLRIWIVRDDAGIRHRHVAGGQHAVDHSGRGKQPAPGNQTIRRCRAGGIDEQHRTQHRERCEAHCRHAQERSHTHRACHATRHREQDRGISGPGDTHDVGLHRSRVSDLGSRISAVPSLP